MSGRAFRAVVTDLDGTVVRADGTVSEATVAACRALQALEVPLIAATARTPWGLRALASLTPYVTVAVCCTGAIGYVPAGDELLWQEQLPAASVAGVLACALRQVPGTGLAVYDGRQWFMTEIYRATRGSEHKGTVSIASAEQLAKVGAYAMAICHPELTPSELITLLSAGGLDTTTATLTVAGHTVVDVAPAGIDKASGVLRALGAVGVASEDAVAFGDMPVDIPMLAVVGQGVAMANAHPDVLAAATSVTDSVDDDGFSRFLGRCGIIESTSRSR